MVDERAVAFGLAVAEGLLERVEHEVRLHGAADPPAHDAAREDVDDEGHRPIPFKVLRPWRCAAREPSRHACERLRPRRNPGLGFLGPRWEVATLRGETWRASRSKCSAVRTGLASDHEDHASGGSAISMPL